MSLKDGQERLSKWMKKVWDKGVDAGDTALFPIFEGTSNVWNGGVLANP